MEGVVFDKILGRIREGNNGGGGKAAGLAVSITYEELVALRNNGNLVPGTWYRITDYNCTTATEDTQSANHAFDIIVRADDNSCLNENAFAAHHDGDEYFAACKLEAWELKYCIDNDTARFGWADSENGTGIIYWMKDEWGNECPYDFKNIQFARVLSLNNEPQGTVHYVYTFNYNPGNAGIDASVLVATQTQHKCFNNVVCERRSSSSNGNYLMLNDNVFLSKDALNPFIFYRNRIGLGSYNNTFESKLINSDIGSDCHDITTGGPCGELNIGSDCHDIEIGPKCSRLNIGSYCHDLDIGPYCYGLTIFNNVSLAAVTSGSQPKPVQNCIILSGQYSSNNAPEEIRFIAGMDHIQVAHTTTRDGVVVYFPVPPK